MIEGGKRTKNIENIKTNKPLISIITVVYNADYLIEKTILSVINQTYENKEHIIIDGNSKDKTLEIIKKYDNYISYWLSEDDNGLYDAMNKGLGHASGDYVLFLNAGDTFYENNTLENIFSSLSYSPDIIYGETMIVDKDFNEIGLRRLKTPDKLTWKSFRMGMLVCHQSIFIKRSITEPYDTRYKITADYEWVLRMLTKSKSIYNSGKIISKFLDGGLNKQYFFSALKERFIIMTHYYGFLNTLIVHLYIPFRFLVFWLKERRI